MQLTRHSSNEKGTVVVDEFGKSYYLQTLEDFERMIRWIERLEEKIVESDRIDDMIDNAIESHCVVVHQEDCGN